MFRRLCRAELPRIHITCLATVRLHGRFRARSPSIDCRTLERGWLVLGNTRLHFSAELFASEHPDAEIYVKGLLTVLRPNTASRCTFGTGRRGSGSQMTPGVPVRYPKFLRKGHNFLHCRHESPVRKEDPNRASALPERLDRTQFAPSRCRRLFKLACLQVYRMSSVLS